MRSSPSCRHLADRQFSVLPSLHSLTFLEVSTVCERSTAKFIHHKLTCFDSSNSSNVLPMSTRYGWNEGQSDPENSMH